LLGHRRDDREQLKKLADGMGIAVRIDSRRLTRKDGTSKALQIVKTTDYHTVKDAREDYTGLKRHETIQTWREYLYDAEYTVALWIRPDSNFSLDELEGALNSPTSLLTGQAKLPTLASALSSPRSSSDLISALQRVDPQDGTVYSEEKVSDRMKRVRDVPLINQPRQFAGRNIYVYGGDHVS